jgi:hypothetical protein
METKSGSTTRMKDFDLLSEDEVRLRTLLKGVKNTTLWGTAIHLVLKEGSIEKFRMLVEQLRSQAKDDAAVMQRIIGAQAMAVLQGTNSGKTSGSCRHFV